MQSGMEFGSTQTGMEFGSMQTVSRGNVQQSVQLFQSYQGNNNLT